MFATLRFAQYWLPPIIWAALIFVASGDQASGEHTSRFVLPLFHRLLPCLTPQQHDALLLATRKVAHLTEYAILAILIWRALHNRTDVPPSQTSLRVAWLTFLICVLYAITDEVHQSFVPSRIGSPFDVVIDAVGAFMGLLVACIWRRRSNRNRLRAHTPTH